MMQSIIEKIVIHSNFGPVIILPLHKKTFFEILYFHGLIK